MRRKLNGCPARPPSSVFRMKKRANLRGQDFIMVESEWRFVGVGLVGVGGVVVGSGRVGFGRVRGFGRVGCGLLGVGLGGLGRVTS